MIIFDIVISIIVLAIGYNIKNRFKILDSYDKKIINKLFFYHILIGFVYYLYILNFGGDSTNYWFITYTNDYDFNDVLNRINVEGSVTGYMLLLNYFPAKYLGLSYLTGTLIYAVLGFIGFLFFYISIKENTPNFNNVKKIKTIGISIFPLLLFLPNLHFWTSGVNKDTLLFFCVALFIYGIKHIRKRIIPLSLSILLSFYIRPHITFFLILSFGFGFMLDRKLVFYQKILILLIFIGGVFSMYSYIQNFVQLESLDFETIQAYGNLKAQQLGGSDTGSSVDTSSYSLPLKIFTFLFRPLFVDGGGILGLVASFENLLLLLLTIKIFFNKPIKAFRKSNHVIKGVIIFFIIGSFAFSLILGNLGIMLRQKTPFIICLMVFGFWCLSVKNLKNKKNATG